MGVGVRQAEARSWCRVWLILPELGIRPFRVSCVIVGTTASYIALVCSDRETDQGDSVVLRFTADAAMAADEGDTEQSLSAPARAALEQGDGNAVRGHGQLQLRFEGVRGLHAYGRHELLPRLIGRGGRAEPRRRRVQEGPEPALRRIHRAFEEPGDHVAARGFDVHQHHCRHGKRRLSMLPASADGAIRAGSATAIAPPMTCSARLRDRVMFLTALIRLSKTGSPIMCPFRDAVGCASVGGGMTVRSSFSTEAIGSPVISCIDSRTRHQESADSVQPRRRGDPPKFRSASHLAAHET